MTDRVTVIRGDVVRQMAVAHGAWDGAHRPEPSATTIGSRVVELLHPPDGLERATPAHRAVHAGVTWACVEVDRNFNRKGARGARDGTEDFLL